MTGNQFNQWLVDMRSAGLIRFKGDAAKLLGKTPEMLRLYGRDGTRETQTDLACAALLAGLSPYK
jgi:hypothetical protein